jgi:hypothetical protein
MPIARVENCQCGADTRDEEGGASDLGLSLGREAGGVMSFLIQRQVGPGHVQHSAYDTPEEALDAATTLMAQGAMSVHIIDPSDHVFTPHRFANQVRRKGRRHRKPRPPNWTGEPG